MSRAAEDAARRGIPVQIVERPAASSLEEAAALQGIRPADIVKTLVVKHQDGSYLFALVPGDRQISWPKLRRLLGVRKLRLPEAELALAATGYERGTITPFGSTTAWPVYADASTAGRRIAMGSGEHGLTLWVEADDLVRGFDAVVADISEPAGG